MRRLNENIWEIDKYDDINMLLDIIDIRKNTLIYLGSTTDFVVGKKVMRYRFGVVSINELNKIEPIRELIKYSQSRIFVQTKLRKKIEKNKGRQIDAVIIDEGLIVPSMSKEELKDLKEILKRPTVKRGESKIVQCGTKKEHNSFYSLMKKLRLIK